MSGAAPKAEVQGDNTALDLNHLRRDARTAVELAIVALAPSDIVDGLAVAAGLLEAVAELPTDSPPVTVLVPKIIHRSRAALDSWSKWQGEHLQKLKA